jgi:hypothetical protein
VAGITLTQKHLEVLKLSAGISKESPKSAPSPLSLLPRVNEIKCHIELRMLLRASKLWMRLVVFFSAAEVQAAVCTFCSAGGARDPLPRWSFIQHFKADITMSFCDNQPDLFTSISAGPDHGPEALTERP